MTAEKSERLLNLLIMLLAQRGFVPKARIRELLYASETDEAFERKFERDKDELRSLGVPIEVGSLDAYFEDEVGYRVRPDELALPEVELTADEAAVVGVAAQVWENARMAGATTEALRKLRAAGHDLDEGALDVAAPRLSAEDESFDVLWEAVQQRVPVRFAYRRRVGDEPAPRRLEPWGMVRASGRWYVAGRDQDRDAPRVFRLSRIVGGARTAGGPGSFEVPAGTDVRAMTTSLAPQPTPSAPATVLVRSGAGHQLRRRAGAVDTDVAGPDTASGWDRLHLPASDRVVADEVLAHGADAYVVAPPALRAEVVDRLRGVLGDAAQGVPHAPGEGVA